MSKLRLEPYLFFKGNCREAMEFYKSVFGGKLDVMEVNMKDFEGYDMPNKEWFKGKIMHAKLEGDFTILASDSPKASAKMAKVELNIGGEDEAKMRKIFDGLAKGGKVNTPLKKQFWGDIWGNVTDKFGVDWMMNIGKGM